MIVDIVALFCTTGSRQTHFAFQACRFADLYSSACINLLHYPDTFLFAAPHQLVKWKFSRWNGVTFYVNDSQMPHEDPALVGEGTSVENGVFSSATPLSPSLCAKLKAKKLSRRKIGKVSNSVLLCTLALLCYSHFLIFWKCSNENLCIFRVRWLVGCLSLTAMKI